MWYSVPFIGLGDMGKVIFLDIDGVFNCKSSKVVHGSISSPHEVSYQLKKDEGLSREDVKFNEISVGLFGDIVNRYMFDVVISSDWRIFMDEYEIIEMFKTYGVDLSDRIKGVTTYLFEGKRGDEICEYVKDNNIISDYLIIDDINDDEFYDYQRTVIVNSDNGLSYSDCLDIISFLKN